MKWFAALALALGAAGASAQPPADPAARLADVARANGFAGVFALSVNGVRVAGGSVGLADPASRTPFRYDMIFPLASVTEQVVATMVAQDVDSGRLALDAPAARYLPAIGRGGPTLRALLQHRSGLRNPDEGQPSGGADALAWCLAGRRTSGARWRHNDCDYVVLGAILERVERRPLPQLYVERIVSATGTGALFAGPTDARSDANWPGGPTPGERQSLLRFGAAGGLVGTAEDVLAFDQALLNNTLVFSALRPTSWRRSTGFAAAAFGQQVVTASLAGCTAPATVVVQRGKVGRFEARNFLIPDKGLALVLLTNAGDDDPEGIESGRGASHAILSAAACA